MIIKQSRVFITGVSGFIGRALVNHMLELGVTVRGSVRKSVQKPYELQLPDLSTGADWSDALRGVDVLIHTAGRAHILNDHVEKPLDEFRKVNVIGTLNLAKQAISVGVKRFVFVSSIGVHGSDSGETSFSESDTPNPKLDYAISKLEAEYSLKQLFDNSKSELVIVRPALVFSADAPGNFRTLLGIANKKILLPFKSIKNRRSIISIENLTEFLTTCCYEVNAGGEDFVIADEEVLSTYEIIDCLARGMHEKSLCFSMPKSIVKLIFSLMGKGATFSKVFGNLEINASKAKKLLNWSPRYSSQELLIKAGFNYRASLGKSNAKV
ncbi:NAD-dependent epimerase/dehydratase family protein [Aliikangiella sp. IMCC44359]|uniref:NAD-dependent epimerase/dehydratase family protein n=1 Tax=Aliikangiella sp. IMCC44359 TaxID=3459125 RepID=UPI00403B000F